jgi:D-serine deaminase-like pyridoxal phosphate-dependent protein
MRNSLPTPCIVIEAAIVRRNIERMAAYTCSKGLGLRPHTKTHKSTRLAAIQLNAGAIGLTVAKAGEAKIMAQATDDLLMAYPPVHPGRCQELAELARRKSVRVGIDSIVAADSLAEAAREAGSMIGILVDLDVGHHRTGVQSPGESLELARQIARLSGLRLDGIMFFPGHLSHGPPEANVEGLSKVSAVLDEVLSLWKRNGFAATIVSGGSTPTAFQSHVVRGVTEIRPGTYIFNDMNGVRCGSATLEDCAARIRTTVVSAAVPGQVVLDAGSKALTSDRCGPAPESGHGYVLEYPQARIAKLSEEHAQVDITGCEAAPKIGQVVSVIPNHICPCINLQDSVWWQEPGEQPQAIPVEARGKVF